MGIRNFATKLLRQEIQPSEVLKFDGLVIAEALTETVSFTPMEPAAETSIPLITDAIIVSGALDVGLLLPSADIAENDLGSVDISP